MRAEYEEDYPKGYGRYTYEKIKYDDKFSLEIKNSFKPYFAFQTRTTGWIYIAVPDTHKGRIYKGHSQNFEDVNIDYLYTFLQVNF